MIVGTAGHVDHGKTALVAALTGVDTDRLKVEKERGITTELGFAPLSLGGDTHSLVDMPGHERFVASMASGASGIDLALLVVALDEGVMPQTREHIDICSLLGVRQGLLVISKMDVAPNFSGDRPDQVEAAIRATARGTPFESVPVVRVSSRTEEGIDQLRDEIRAAASKVARHSCDGLFALGVDRVFTLKGFGTVVTGTTLSGVVRRDDLVELLPQNPGPIRVRGLQSLGEERQQIAAGERGALNLTGVEVGEVSRGMLVAHPGTIRPSRRLDVELRLLSSAPRLRARDPLVCHLGTASVACRVSVLGRPEVAPGERAFAQLVLEQPLPALAGQRFLLRGFQNIDGAGRTVGGGEVLLTEAPRRRPSAPHSLARLRFDGEAGGPADSHDRIEALLSHFGGLSEQELLERSGMGRQAIAKALLALKEQGRVRREEQTRWVPAGAPSTRAPEAAVVPQVTLDLLDRAVLEELRRGDLAPPTVAELKTRLRAPSLTQAAIERTLDRLCAAGFAVRASDGLFFESRCLARFRSKVVDYLRREGQISIADFKTLTGGTRRFAIPLTELFDKEKLTLRVGDKRILRERHRG